MKECGIHLWGHQSAAIRPRESHIVIREDTDHADRPQRGAENPMHAAGMHTNSMSKGGVSNQWENRAAKPTWLDKQGHHSYVTHYTPADTGIQTCKETLQLLVVCPSISMHHERKVSYIHWLHPMMLSETNKACKCWQGHQKLEPLCTTGKHIKWHGYWQTVWYFFK